MIFIVRVFRTRLASCQVGGVNTTTKTHRRIASNWLTSLTCDTGVSSSLEGLDDQIVLMNGLTTSKITVLLHVLVLRQATELQTGIGDTEFD